MSKGLNESRGNPGRSYTSGPGTLESVEIRKQGSGALRILYEGEEALYLEEDGLEISGDFSTSEYHLFAEYASDHESLPRDLDDILDGIDENLSEPEGGFDHEF